MTQEVWTTLTGDESGTDLVISLNKRLTAADEGQTTTSSANTLKRNALFAVEDGPNRSIFISNGDGTGDPLLPGNILNGAGDQETAREALGLGELATLGKVTYESMSELVPTAAELLSGGAQKFPTVEQTRQIAAGAGSNFRMIDDGTWNPADNWAINTNGTTNEYWFIRGYVKGIHDGYSVFDSVQKRLSPTSSWFTISGEAISANRDTSYDTWLLPGQSLRFQFRYDNGFSYSRYRHQRTRFAI